MGEGGLGRVGGGRVGARGRGENRRVGSRRARTYRRAGQVRGVGECAVLELKASESTAPAAPTRKARHDHLTRKLRRESRRKARREIRPATRPHRTAHAKHQHAAARTHRPLRAALLPLLLRAHRPAYRRQLGHRRQRLLPRAQPLLRPNPRARRRRQRRTGHRSTRRRLRRPHLMGGNQRARTRRYPQPRLHAHDAAHRSHRPAHDPRNGQAPRPVPRRGRLRGKLPALVRRRSRPQLRPHRRCPRIRATDHHRTPPRRPLPADYPLELPARHGGTQGRPGARGGLYRGAQARLPDSAQLPVLRGPDA